MAAIDDANRHVPRLGILNITLQNTLWMVCSVILEQSPEGACLRQASGKRSSLAYSAADGAVSSSAPASRYQ